MPFAHNRDHKIHYTVEGEGPLIILQHGFLDNSESWKEAGYVEGLKAELKVACVDSLGHGKSDKPTDAESYLQSHRAGDLIAVIDDIGEKQAHLLGYSMGGWMAVGVAKYFPERLKPLMIAGWDCVDGMATAFRPMGVDRIDFNTFFDGAKSIAPELTEWVTDDLKEPLALCYEQLYDLEGSKEAVLAFKKPILLWDGQDDPYHDPMQKFAKDNGFTFVSTSGDHILAMMDSAHIVTREIKDFIGKS